MVKGIFSGLIIIVVPISAIVVIAFFQGYMRYKDLQLCMSYGTAYKECKEEIK